MLENCLYPVADGEALGKFTHGREEHVFMKALVAAVWRWLIREQAGVMEATKREEEFKGRLEEHTGAILHKELFSLKETIQLWVEGMEARETSKEEL